MYQIALYILDIPSTSHALRSTKLVLIRRVEKMAKAHYFLSIWWGRDVRKLNCILLQTMTDSTVKGHTRSRYQQPSTLKAKSGVFLVPQKVTLHSPLLHLYLISKHNSFIISKSLSLAKVFILSVPKNKKKVFILCYNYQLRLWSSHSHADFKDHSSATLQILLSYNSYFRSPSWIKLWFLYLKSTTCMS